MPVQKTECKPPNKSLCKFGLDLGRYIENGKNRGPPEKVEWVLLLHHYNYVPFSILKEDPEIKDLYTCEIYERVGCKSCPAYLGENKE